MAEMLASLVRLLVVRCLAFVVVRALMPARVNAGALCSTVAASSALTGATRFRFALLRALGRWVGTD